MLWWNLNQSLIVSKMAGLHQLHAKIYSHGNSMQLLHCDTGSTCVKKTRIKFTSTGVAICSGMSLLLEFYKKLKLENCLKCM